MLMDDYNYFGPNKYIPHIHIMKSKTSNIFIFRCIQIGISPPIDPHLLEMIKGLIKSKWYVIPAGLFYITSSVNVR